ncbi:MAG TPA: hypothetical protein VNV66_01705, partial [Pilimelia sp.]|nr:hypothetical protein [Pilimelia sp.]
MSQSESRHRAAWLAVAVFAGLPLAASAAPALAGPGVAGSPGAEPAGGVAVVSGVADSPVESGRQVVFRGGGVLGVSCGANPDTTSVSVPAESTLRVVNRTGHRATLLLDGTARGEIGKGSTAEVLFHRGPVALKIKPHCVLSEESAAVRVRVQARQTTPPPPQAVPSTPTAPAPDPAP